MLTCTLINLTDLLGNESLTRSLRYHSDMNDIRRFYLVNGLHIHLPACVVPDNKGFVLYYSQLNKKNQINMCSSTC